MSSGPLTVIVDGGLDDALALGVLVGSGVALDQVIATEGSVGLEPTIVATRRWLATLGNGVLVRAGADRGIASDYPDMRDPFHGVDAFGGKLSSLAEVAEGVEGWQELPSTVLCTGALTVVAQAWARGQHPHEIVWMGGAVASGGNMTAAAEFNAWMDPAATDAVLTSGVPTRMVPLDITGRFEWSKPELERLRDSSRPGRLLADAIGTLGRVFVPHDAVAVVSFLKPDLFRWTPREVRCETSGEVTTGATVVDRRQPATDAHVSVADDVDVASVNDGIFSAFERLA